MARRRRTTGTRALLTALVVLLSASQLAMLPLVLHLAPSSVDDGPAGAVPRPPAARAPASREASRRRAAARPRADGTLNGYPIYYRENRTLHSSVSCVGENYRPDAWMHRSCQFRHLCFHLEDKEFVLFQSREEQAMEASLRDFAFASNSMNTSVAIGGINIKRDVKQNHNSMRWFPRVARGSLSAPYYELDPRVVWIPFHSFFAGNPGHLVWDDFLPIYTLLRMFALDRAGAAPSQSLLTRYVVREEGQDQAQRLWATCEWTTDKREACRRMYAKFLPLLGLHADNFTTTRDVRVEIADGPRRSALVCAARGAAGIGMLTDHGGKLHGWSRKDYDSMHNHGRGALLYEFRNFMVTNVLQGSDAAAADRGDIGHRNRPKGPPYAVTVSFDSSETRKMRDRGITEALEKAFGDTIHIQKVKLKELSLEEQIRLAASTAIFVTMSGGGAVTAMFLPRGSSVLVFYVEDGGVEKGKKTHLPALLDWDVLNNMAWLRVHWMPAKLMRRGRPADIDALVKVVGHELDIMRDEDSL